MKKSLFRSIVATAVLAAVFAASSSAMAAEDAGTGNLAVVNGTAIPMTQYDQILDQFKKSGQQVTDAMKDRLKKELISREVLLQAAQKANLQTSKEYVDDLKNAQQAILINVLMKKEMDKIQISDADAKAEYDKFVQSNNSTEYKADHILVATEAQAKKIIAQLNKDKGANFAELAKKDSKDTGSAVKGGDLGWASPSNYVPAFAAALEKLKKGEWTQTPVKSQFGYHIIKLDDTRTTPLPKFDDVKKQIIMQLKQQKMAQFQDQLVKDAKIQ